MPNNVKTLMIKAAIIFLIILFLPAQASAAETVELVIQGLDAAARDNAQKAAALPYGLVQDGKVNIFWLERFRKEVPRRVAVALQPYGYYHPDVTTSLQKLENNIYRLIIQVDPGKPVRISGVNVTIEGPGKDEKTLRKLLDDFPLKTGDVLVQPLYEGSKSALRSRAVELGYLDAGFPTHVITLDPAQLSATIDLRMETGPQYLFNGIRFEGAPRYPEKFLYRFVTFKPGEVFSHARMGETQVNLINSERFRQVVPVPEKEEAQDNRVPVLIRLEEAPTKRVRPGVGYATDIGPRFSLEYRDLNVFERGHEFRSELNLSERLQSLGAGYVLPGEEMDSLTGLQANLRRENVASYTTRIASSEVNQTISIGRGRLGTAYFRLEREKSTVADEPVDSRILLPGLRVSEQRYDSVIRPTRGRHVSIDVRGTHQAIGSNNRFLQVVAEGSLLTPLSRTLSLYLRGKTGVTFQNAPLGELPVSYRFFAGGDRSVRGYGYQSLGPVDDSGRVRGGRDTLVGSVELIHRMSRNWGVAAFYDAGNAFNSFNDFRLLRGAGLGLRYYTIVGLVRFDVARQIAVPDPSYRIHLTVGFAF